MTTVMDKHGISARGQARRAVVAASVPSRVVRLCAAAIFVVCAFGVASILGQTSGGAVAPPPMHLNAPMVGMAATSNGLGYWMVGSDGGVFTFGDAGFAGSMGGHRLNAPVVGMAAGPDGGYWLAAADGGVFTFGGARFYGSMGGTRLNAPVVGIASTPNGDGYWLVASDGGVFTFGDARFYGSMGGKHLNRPVVGIASTPNGDGYWLVASDGGVFTFGDARFWGSMGGRRLDAPVVGMAADDATGGYWMVGSDGGVFSFGAPFMGSEGGRALPHPVKEIVATSSGDGYWLGGDAGAVYTFGKAPYEGAINGILPGSSDPPPSQGVATRIVSIAESQVGQTDPYLYGPIGEDWCAYFTTWVWQHAGLRIPSYAFAYQVGAWALANGGTLLPPTATPQVGDSVLFEPPGSSMAWPDEAGLNYPNIEHVNIVVKVLPGNQIITVGGGESGAVREQGPYSAADASSWWGQAIYGFVQPPGV